VKAATSESAEYVAPGPGSGWVSGSGPGAKGQVGARDRIVKPEPAGGGWLARAGACEPAGPGLERSFQQRAKG
jgi:hypothetical protein